MTALDAIGGLQPVWSLRDTFGQIDHVLRGSRAVARVMKSVSFGQYAEDLLFATTLLPKNRGFYLDVGAYHPWKGSNTYKLYLRGWSGVTVEPNPAAEKPFRKWRPRDKHAVMGVAEADSALTYYEFTDAKLNTFSQEQAKIYQADGKPLVRRRTVACHPLQTIVDEYAPGHGVDLLSVDCEGFDLIVLNTLNFDRTRPTAILVEDFEGFQLRRRGRGSSPIEAFLFGQGYELIGQSLFTSLFVDSRVLGRQTSGGFNAADWQFR